MSTILIIDDEPGIRDVLSDVLADEGHAVIAAEDGPTGLGRLAAGAVDLVFLDVWLPNLGGIDVLRRIREEFPDVAVVMISGHANIKLAVEAVKIGAFDFLEKPLSLERTLTAARNALALAALRLENRTLKNGLFVEDTMVGSSDGMRRVRELIEQAAASDSRILVLGENGTGKELVAREVHRRSRRSSGPFVEVNCAALPEPLIESELFGHEKGAFTSAHTRRRGKLELAHRGTLFLDEIADMSLVTQAKVLRVLQEMRFERVGGEESITVDVRVIAATNRDIEGLVRERQFREDLYFRINVVPIRVPALRERLDDLPELVAYFLGRFRRPSEESPRRISAEGMAALAGYGWPGNVRELKNFIERITIMCEESVISVDSVRRFLGSSGVRGPAAAVPYEGLTLGDARDRFERDLIAAKLAECGGNVARTAEALGMHAGTLHSKMKKLRIAVHKP